jgi:hypothetical protein
MSKSNVSGVNRELFLNRFVYCYDLAVDTTLLTEASLCGVIDPRSS